jgi:hypothetical protein
MNTTINLRDIFRINKKKVYSILLIFFLFFYLYGITFTFLPLSTARIIVLLAFFYFITYSLTNHYIKIDNGLRIISALYLLYLFWTLFITVAYGFEDISILTSTLLLFVHSFIGGLFFSVIFQKMKISFRKFLMFIQIVITIQAIFILIYFISWDFREFTFNYIKDSSDVDQTLTIFRSRGLTSTFGATLSVVQSFGLIISAYLLSTVKTGTKEYYYIVFSFGLILFSIVVTGRTGLIMLPFVMFYFFVMFLKRNGIPKNITSFIFILPVVVFISFIFVKFIYTNFGTSIGTAWGEDIFDRVIRWYTEEFFDNGKIQSRTADTLLDHLFLPHDTLTILFGDPTTWKINRIKSDIGLIRMWHSVGITGIIIYYTLILLVFLYSIFKINKTEERLVLIIIAIFLFLIEMKEPFLQNIQVNVFYIMFFTYAIINLKGINSYRSE